ncbi:MAG: hypothetical protein JWO30_1855 [Fibrobacteres bacterium]|nr:hypothetical protein [Fibrobacterota bacterium]
MVLKHASLLSLALLTAGFSETLTDRMDLAVEKMASKHGVEIGGGINSEYFNSDLSGSAASDSLYTYETTQFTSFDMDMSYRPYDFVGARAILRFHQDWQTFFATRSRIVGARWLSMDGNIAKMLSFNAGDFKQKYTPLTLWAPELDLVYEPEIFSSARTRLMDDQFLGDNNRLLQGLNLNFAKRINSPVTEIRADAIGSRIRRAEFLDANGWQALRFTNDRDGDGKLDPVSLATADMDRYFMTGNAEALLWDNIVVGGTYQALIDDRDNFQPAVFSKNLQDGIIATGNQAYLDGLSLNGGTSVVASDLRIIAAHGGVDGAGFLGNSNLVLEALGEYASSSQSNVNAWHFRRDSTSKILFDYQNDLPGKDGTALNLQLGAGYASEGKFAVKLDADYLNNSEDFENPLAQSPTFVASRIMNTENDLAGGRLYSTFDALNNGVYKFTPGNKAAGYQLAPFSKTSYNNGVFTSQEISGFSGDPVVQLMLPMGMATPNRTGFKTRLTGEIRSAYHAIVDFASMKEVKSGLDTAGAEAATFTQMGGGVMLELDKAFDWTTPLDLSASYVQTKAERASLAREAASPNIEVALMQFGLTYRFFTKWRILGGYQQADVKSPQTLVQAGVRNQFDMKEKQTHFRLGVEYSLSKKASFLVSGGLLTVDRDGTHRGTDAAAAPNPALDSHSDFSQTLTQALVKVRF